MINSSFRTGNNYNPQVFLEECKYTVKEKQMSKYITDDIETSSDSHAESSNRENSDEEKPGETKFDEEN